MGHIEAGSGLGLADPLYTAASKCAESELL